MSRLLVHVEGETEESFVNEVLRPYLAGRGFTQVAARLIGNARQRDRRGGIRPWSAAKRDIVRHLKQDRGSIGTTLVDYYGLPAVGERAWPGRASLPGTETQARAQAVERALLEDVGLELSDRGAARRFVPFVVMHEFEGLLFSDCAAFARGLARLDLEGQLREIRNQFGSPEDINDSPVSSPSKRVQALLPGYQKPLMGTLAALEIGIESILQECTVFRGWIDRLIDTGAAVR